jgi:nitrogen fixation NifU-like protein
MDRETRLAWLIDHFQRPRHKGAMADAEAQVPGGNPGCGDVITMYVKDGAVTWEGAGCTLSQAAASILVEKVNREHISLDEILALTPEAWMDVLGREIAESRPGCALLALGTLKGAAKTVEMNRKLKAAGYSDERIRELRRAVAEQGAATGVVVGEGAERAASEPR